MNPLITAAELAITLETSVVLDCRSVLGQRDAGREQYHAGHIPGARHAELDRELSGPVTPDSGRHPLPEPAQLAQQLGRWGITPHRDVVVYDDAGGAYAARAWWLLRWLGHDAVAVLDGGLSAWLNAGGALESEEPDATIDADYPLPDRPQRATVEVADILANIDTGVSALVDARTAPRFNGKEEPIDPVAGHVPGALNRPLSENLDSRGYFKSPEQLRREWLALLNGRSCIAMCGSGVTACHHLVALEIAGLPAGTLYPGSWSEWIRQPHRPVAKT